MKIKQLLRVYVDQLSNTTTRIRQDHRVFMPALVLDQLFCSLRYGASPMNYLEYDFCGKSSAERANYITFRSHRKLLKKYNDPARANLVEDKLKFSEVFSAYYGRKVLDVRSSSDESILDFLRENTYVIAKPRFGNGGTGITRLEAAEFDTGRAVREFVHRNVAQNVLLDQGIVQHPDLSRLNASSVNTIRVLTLVAGQGPKLVAATLRIGNGGVADNVDQGGIRGLVDIDTGELMSHGMDKHKNTYEFHPISGEKIMGFNVPFWAEIRELLASASQVVPGLRMIGWDVAVTPQGPLLIEANTQADIGTQVMHHVVTGTGLKRKLMELA